MGYHSGIALICFGGLVSGSPLVYLMKFLPFNPEFLSPQVVISSYLFVVLSFVGSGAKPLCTADTPHTELPCSSS